jgi:WD40 repeat protein
VAKKWIEDLKYSPDNKMLAVTSHDCKVYVCDSKTMKVKKHLQSSSAYISHCDWSQDSQSIVTNDGSGERLYYRVDGNGKNDPSGVSTYRDEEWNTHNCVLSWPT